VRGTTLPDQLITWENFLLHPTPAELKKLVRSLVQKTTLAPKKREVEITYRLPEPVMNNLVAGAGFEPATFGL